MKIQHMLFVGLAAWGGMMAYRAQKIIAPFLVMSHEGSESTSNVGGIGNVGGFSYNADEAATTPGASKSTYGETPSFVSSYTNSSGSNSPFSYRAPEKDDAEKTLAMFKAAADGDLDALRDFAQDRTKINARDGQRRTALMFAALNGQNDACRILLGGGANVRLKDPRGFSALDYAAGRGHTETVRLILQASGTRDDQHVLPYAALMEGAFSGDKNRLPKNASDYVSVNTISPEDQSPLIVAAGNGSADIVEALIAHGADVNLLNSQRQTALHWAAWNNKSSTIAVLLAKGARIDTTDLGGNTALMFAAQNGNQEAVSLLLEKGADKTMTDQKGSTAMTMAKTKGHKNISSMMQ